MHQGDELMRRKMENLVRRQQATAAESCHKGVFQFTEQLSVPRRREGGDAMPDNWAPAAAGGYFSEKQRGTGQTAPHGHNTSAAGGTESHRNRNTGSPASQPRRRESPADMQARQASIVQSRILNALEEQRASEAARLEACKAQRDLEILKFHQKMKQRTELQIRSSQLVLGHSVGEMGLEHLHEATMASTTTRAAAEKAEHLCDAQAQFIDYNRDRMERNALHRQYCLEAHRERQQFRQGLEAHIGTTFSKSKTKLLHDIGVTGPEATFTGNKTILDLRQQKETYETGVREAEAEAAEVIAMSEELNALDEKLWAAVRQAKGHKSVRTREIEYSLEAPYRRSGTSQT